MLKIQTLTTDCSYNFSDNNEKDDEIEFEENEAGEMVPKRKNPGPWKVTEPEPTPPPKGNYRCLTKFISLSCCNSLH